MRRNYFLIIGLILLIAVEIMKVYFIMPFPGSQQSNTISIAYFINNNIWWIRILLLITIFYPCLYYLVKGSAWQKILIVLCLGLYGFIFYMFNYKFLADKMFYQPKEKLFANAAADTTNKNKLVIGVALNGEAKAYPIEIIGYHHQVKDTVGNTPVMVTYCTVCRTGRVYSPFVNGKFEQFRLVGMDHFNAMFEDATTKSWWRQENGEAITGALKGKKLEEIPSTQMRLGDWITLHPNTMVLQPDKNFLAKYDSLEGFDEGTLKSSLEARDTGSWKMKSWVVGVQVNNHAKAYDWNELVKNKKIQDSITGMPLLLTIDSTGKTFYVFNRRVDGQTLHFSTIEHNGSTVYGGYAIDLIDAETHSLWNPNGSCFDGVFKGKQLTGVQAYQEFWHSWESFHPGTEKYK